MKKIYILIFLIFCFHLINNFFIIEKDNLPFIYDQRGFYHRSVALFTSIKDSLHFRSPEPFWLTIKDITIYPPLRHLFSLILYLILGLSYKSALYSNLVYFLILLIFLYKLTRELFGEETALLASFLVSLFPGVFGYSRLYMLDFPILALFPLGAYFLYKMPSSNSNSYYFLTGLILAIGYLHKQTFLIFILPAFIYALWVSFRRRKNLGSFIRNLFLILLGLSPALIWSWINIDAQGFLANVSFDFRHNLNPEALRNILWLNFYRFQLYPFTALSFFFVALPLFFFRERKYRLILLYISLILLYQISLLPEDLPRHNMPVLILIGVIMARVLERGFYLFRSSRLKNLLIFIFLSILTVQFFYLCYFRNEPVSKSEMVEYLEERFQYTGLIQPRKFNFPVQKLREIISEQTRSEEEVAVLILKEEPVSELLYFLMNGQRIRYHFVPIYRLGRLVSTPEGKVKVVPELKGLSLLLLPFKLEEIPERADFIDLPEIHRELFFQAFALYLERASQEELSDLSLERLEMLFQEFLAEFWKEARRYTFVAQVKLDPEIFTEYNEFFIYHI